MKLQFLIPQYNESDGIIKPLLDSIALQQNIDFNDIGCIIANDGSDTKLSERLLNSYPFEIQYFKCAHNGVSATRNFCFKQSTAEYVMFCDADDLFFNVCGLYIIFNEIHNGGFDVLVSSFIEETRDPNRVPVYVTHQLDTTFVHGKVYNRKFLINNNIKWNDNLTIHEDAFFNNLCNTLSKNGKFCPNPFYLWKWRDASVCRHDPLYLLKTYNNMLDSTRALTNEYSDRQLIHEAQIVVTQVIFDAYYTMNKEEWLKQENQEYKNNVENYFKSFYHDFKYLFDALPQEEKSAVIINEKNKMFKEGLYLETITFADWISKFN